MLRSQPGLRSYCHRMVLCWIPK